MISVGAKAAYGYDPADEAVRLECLQVYYAGFEIVYKRLAIGYTFYDISALPNCSKFAVTYR